MHSWAPRWVPTVQKWQRGWEVAPEFRGSRPGSSGKLLCPLSLTQPQEPGSRTALADVLVRIKVPQYWRSGGNLWFGKTPGLEIRSTSASKQNTWQHLKSAINTSITRNLLGLNEVIKTSHGVSYSCLNGYQNYDMLHSSGRGLPKDFLLPQCLQRCKMYLYLPPPLHSCQASRNYRVLSRY